MTPIRIVRDAATLLIVDIQAKLFPHIAEHDSLQRQAIRMARAARELGLPIVVSEQYREGLGATLPSVMDVVGDAVLVEKMAFSVCGDAAAMNRIDALSRRHVLLVGIETHVCVQQTALDLLERGMSPFVLADAVGSRHAVDRDVALDRMRHAGIVVTTVESAIFEMTREAGTDVFRRILPIVR
jgi:nicotinamidase-related amidase